MIREQNTHNTHKNVGGAMVLTPDSKPGITIPRWAFSVVAILIVAWWLSMQPPPQGERGAAPPPDQNVEFEPSIPAPVEPAASEPEATSQNDAALSQGEPSRSETQRIEPVQDAETPKPFEAAKSSPTSKRPDTTAAKKRDTDPLVIANVTIKDQSGRVAFKGDIDLHSTFERIDRGEKFPHRNDGSTFRNLEGRLPKKPAGYYKEYVHPTPGLNGPGPQRIVIGKNGEAFYTSDHYQSFRKVRE
jgi:ribonuclease T1